MLVGFVLGCSTPAPSPDASAMDSAVDGYASSCVGTCVAGACTTQVAACNADPTCASYLACVGQCPTTSNGDADPACVAACPAVSGSAGTNAQAAYDACREESLMGACASCNGSDGGTIDTSCGDAAVLNQMCGASTQTDACLKCASEKCCDSVAVLASGGPATDLGYCIAACGQPDGGAVNGKPTLPCIQACESQYPSGIAGVGQYLACVGVKCDAIGACDPTDMCAACSYQHCGCEYVACQTDVNCAQIIQCETTCSTQACADACGKAADAGVGLAVTYGTCIAQHCKALCGG